MFTTLIAVEELESELRRHGLVKLPLTRGKMAAWRNTDGSIVVTLPKYVGFIPHTILIDALRQAGIPYEPRLARQ